jgi:hypothetical protein
MFAYITDEIEEEVILHPIVVIDNLSTIDGIVEIEEFRKLFTDALDIVVDFLGGEKLTFLSLERRVANHTRGTPYKGERFVPSYLEVLEQHDADKVADVEGIGCGVDANISGGYLFGELFLGAWHDVVNHAAPFEFLDKIFVHRMRMKYVL